MAYAAHPLGPPINGISPIPGQLLHFTEEYPTTATLDRKGKAPAVASTKQHEQVPECSKRSEWTPPRSAGRIKINMDAAFRNNN